MLTIPPSYVREMARKGRVQFTDHVTLLRMGERKIWKDDIFEAIIHGEVIEIQDLGPKKDIAVIFQEAVDKQPRFYVVVATSFPQVSVITVAEFKKEAWEWLGKIMARRRKE